MNAGQYNSPLDAPAAQVDFAAAMQDPAAYSALHPVPGPVACIETHVSWVFLTGPFAYKVKKPLRLSFIDYSTTERRLEMCREELHLNRRHAPGLYVDVVPITGTPAAPRVGATDAPPFEHALRMVQFDPRLELTRLLQSGDVEARELQLAAESTAQQVRRRQRPAQVAERDRAPLELAGVAVPDRTRECGRAEPRLRQLAGQDLGRQRGERNAERRRDADGNQPPGTLGSLGRLARPPVTGPATCHASASGWH